MSIISIVMIIGTTYYLHIENVDVFDFPTIKSRKRGFVALTHFYFILFRLVTPKLWPSARLWIELTAVAMNCDIYLLTTT